MIDRRFLFDHVRTHLFGGRLRSTQVTGLNAILDAWERDHDGADDRWLAYTLATAHHETDRTFQPLEEYGRGKGRPYGEVDPVTGHRFFGRGLVQLTWKANYRTFSTRLDIDLVHEPERALELDVAVAILIVGMREGLFTGRTLADYFSATADDWRGARRIVNGLDKASLIADYGRRYYAAIARRGATATPP